MNRSYNHIKYLVENNDEVIGIYKTLRGRPCLDLNQAGNHDVSQLDGKQRHAGFNYYEYDVPKFATPG